MNSVRNHQHAELRRHNIEPLGDILANPVKLAFAARTGFVVDTDDCLDAWQMGGQRAAVASAPACGFRALGSRAAFFLRRGAGLRLFDILQRQQHLVFGERGSLAISPFQRGAPAGDCCGKFATEIRGRA